MIKVEYDSNNSGGNWWLTDEDWYALENAGWTVRWRRNETNSLGGADKDGRWLGALATEASKEFNSMREGVEEWERITGGYAAEEGCNCCGQPHNFSGNDTVTGEYVNGPEIVRNSYLEW